MKALQVSIITALMLVFASVSYAEDITISWPMMEYAWGTNGGYKIYYDTDGPAAPFNGTGLTEGDSPITIADETVTSYTLTGRTTTSDYYITVRPFNDGGDGAYTDVLHIPPLSNYQNVVKTVGTGSCTGPTLIADTGVQSGDSDVTSIFVPVENRFDAKQGIISGYYKHTGTTEAYAVLFCAEDDVDSFCLTRNNSDTSIIFSYNNSGATHTDTVTNIYDGNWHFIKFSWDHDGTDINSTLQIGNIVETEQSTTVAEYAETGNLLFGSNSAGNRWEGCISDINVYTTEDVTPLDGTKFNEGFLGTGYELSWTETLGSGTINEDATLSGTPPSGSNTEGLKVTSNGDTLDTKYTFGQVLPYNNNYDLYFELYINSGATLDDGDIISMTTLGNATAVTQANTYLQLRWNTGDVYALRTYSTGGVASSFENITEDVWHTIHIHSDRVDDESYFTVDEGTKTYYTRGDYDIQYLFFLFAAGAGDIQSYEIGRVWMNYNDSPYAWIETVETASSYDNSRLSDNETLGGSNVIDIDTAGIIALNVNTADSDIYSYDPFEPVEGSVWYWHVKFKDISWVSTSQYNMIAGLDDGDTTPNRTDLMAVELGSRGTTSLSRFALYCGQSSSAYVNFDDDVPVGDWHEIIIKGSANGEDCQYIYDDDVDIKTNTSTVAKYLQPDTATIGGASGVMNSVAAHELADIRVCGYENALDCGWYERCENEYSEDTDGYTANMNSSSTVYWAMSFTASADQILRSLSTLVSRTGAPGGELEARIYNDNSGSPGSLFGTSSSIQGDAIPTSASLTTFRFTPSNSVELSNTSTYWVVYYGTGSYDGSNYLTFSYDGGTAGEAIKYSSDGSVWNTQDTSAMPVLYTYSGECDVFCYYFPDAVICEDFEEYEIPYGWADQGAPDYELNASAIAGRESLSINYSEWSDTYTFPDMSTVYLGFKIQFIALANGADSNFVQLRDSSDTVIGELRVRAADTIRVMQGGTGGSSTATVTAATDYYFWVKWVVGTGSDGYMSLYGGTSPIYENATEYYIVTTGFATTDVAYVKFEQDSSDTSDDIIFDNIVIQDSPIGDM